MRAHKRLLISLAALAAAGLAGCLNSPDSASTLSAPVTEAEIQAALTADSLHPVPPPRAVVCDTLKARLALLDSTAAQFKGLSYAVTHVCAVPDSALRPPKGSKPPKPDSLKAKDQDDSLRLPPPPRPKGDSLLPPPPKPPKDDSLKGVPPVKPDSGKGRPLPPPPPRGGEKDSR